MIRWAAVLLVACAAVPGAEAQKREAPHAVIAGTVFRDPGYALPDVKVLLVSADERRKKLQETTSNYRGEFAFHVPPQEAKYVVRAIVKGYRPEEKEAAISGEERIDVNLVLKPESK